MCLVRQELRNEETCVESDQMAQFSQTHCGATIVSGIGADELRTVPSEELAGNATEHQPVIAVRIFHGGAAAVLVHLAYYYHYGYVRCNLAQDSELEEGVYAYVDIAAALKSLTKKNAKDRVKCLGLVSGYLKHKQNQKGRMCLDSRSCKLLAIFVSWRTEISLPFELGVEDALAFRLPPIPFRRTCQVVSSYEQLSR